MPRYYFHVYHKSSQTGYEGEKLPGNEAAWKEATAMAGRILQDIDGSLAPGAEPWRWSSPTVPSASSTPRKPLLASEKRTVFFFQWSVVLALKWISISCRATS
jgi:hypothetical protein